MKIVAKTFEEVGEVEIINLLEEGKEIKRIEKKVEKHNQCKIEAGDTGQIS